MKQGVPDAITIFKEMKEAGTLPKVYGIRLDSGDLGLSLEGSHKMFTAAGFPDASSQLRMTLMKTSFLN